MQTFLPFADFRQSARSLDTQRLGKQRVEAKQLLLGLHIADWSKLRHDIQGIPYGDKYGWTNHPASLMWKGHTGALAYYGIAICDEWIARGKVDTLLADFKAFVDFNNYDNSSPWWIGYELFHLSHRSNLIRKYPAWYKGVQGWTDPPDLEYYWPGVTNEKNRVSVP